MLNRLYEGTLTHYRGNPAHSFSYDYWMVLINLDEIDALCALSPLVSENRFNLLSFHRDDYLPADDSLKARVNSEIARVTSKRFNGDIFLLTSLRQLGYAMNPLSLFFCLEDGIISYIVAEVHNTPWSERHTYVLTANGCDEWRVDKDFHVSPFMPMDTVYHWQISTPDDTAQIDIDVSRDNNIIFSSSLCLQSLPWTAGSLHRLLLTYGLQPAATIFRIYRQAFSLWLKKATFYPHPDTHPAALSVPEGSIHGSSHERMKGEIRES